MTSPRSRQNPATRSETTTAKNASSVTEVISHTPTVCAERMAATTAPNAATPTPTLFHATDSGGRYPAYIVGQDISIWLNRPLLREMTAGAQISTYATEG